MHAFKELLLRIFVASQIHWRALMNTLPTQKLRDANLKKSCSNSAYCSANVASYVCYGRCHILVAPDLVRGLNSGFENSQAYSITVCFKTSF